MSDISNTKPIQDFTCTLEYLLHCKQKFERHQAAVKRAKRNYYVKNRESCLATIRACHRRQAQRKREAKLAALGASEAVCVET